MIDFVKYIVSELKSKRLAKDDALSLLRQYSSHASEQNTVCAIHPLLHVNTSDLEKQRFEVTLTGEEFFLKDHQLDGQKVLPAVTYIEMARGAVEESLPFALENHMLELRDIVWIQPIIVTGTKVIAIDVVLNESAPNLPQTINFEIYCMEEEEKIIHCRGQAALIKNSPPHALNIPSLKERMSGNLLESVDVYTFYRKMGARFGPTHQAIQTIFVGDDQLLASLRLPLEVEEGFEEYVLHPSMMDAALQSVVGFFHADNDPANSPLSLPFAIESLKVFSGCRKEMYAWLQRLRHHQCQGKIEKYKIDLLDDAGNVCVQIDGYSSREVTSDAGILMATPVWEPAHVATLGEVIPFEEHHVLLVEMPEIDARAVESQLINCRCERLIFEKGTDIAENFQYFTLACFNKLRSILQSNLRVDKLLQIIIPDDRGAEIAMGIGGLLKTAHVENPGFRAQIIVTDKAKSPGELTDQLTQETKFPQDTLVRYKDGQRRVMRWQFIPDNQVEATIPFKDDGVYVITGGLGGLGVIFAKEILMKTSRAKVILSGRTDLQGLKEEKLEILSALKLIRDGVDYRPLNLDDLSEVEKWVESIILDHKQLNGVLHIAGMLADEFILKKNVSDVRKVLHPKVNGTVHLDLATKDIDLDFFTLFSSVSAAFGNMGQADYAAANGFMDRFADFRNKRVSHHERKGKTLSINWPLWLEGGMKPDEVTQKTLLLETGMRPLQTVSGVQSFYRSLMLPHTQVLVMEGYLSRMTSLFSERQDTMAGRSRSEIAEDNSKIDLNADLGKVQEYIIKEFSRVLKLPIHRVDADRRESFEKYGIDSIISMNLTAQFEKTFGPLPKTLFFEYQSIHALAEYFVEMFPRECATLGKAKNIIDSIGRTDVVPTNPGIMNKQFVARKMNLRHQMKFPSTHSVDTEPVAIVGLSGRYPEAMNVEEYWENLRKGKDCITEIPGERWDWRRYYDEDRVEKGRHYSKWGGFIAGADEFDPQFFHISPREAMFMDPQERIFLQHVWMAVEDAGYTRKTLSLPDGDGLPAQVGVYVGLMYSEYQMFGVEATVKGNPLPIAGSYASMANRVSYVLNLHGPSLTLDSMCSSSLLAIHLACQDLKLGHTNLAIAGGVNLSIHPSKYLFLSSAQFISTNGHCQSFGEGGDGYIPAEGVGVVILKRLSDAIKDGDHIYGTIKGTAVNHGGKTNGYSVPNLNAQAAVIEKAMQNANIHARDISYVEAHGTGTKLGDPIEIAALSKAFQHYTRDKEFCFIGSAKSNIGHCESAAGMAGLTKVLLQMKHRMIVPSLHSSVLNPFIDFQNTPFFVNQSLRPWEPVNTAGEKIPRIAGLSAFGAGGTNAHLIIEEYAPVEKNGLFPAATEAEPLEVAIPLSARTKEQVKQIAANLLRFVEVDVDISSLAYTLQVGRESMEVRVGFIISSIDELKGKLKAFIDEGENAENLFYGHPVQNRNMLSSFSVDEDFEEVISRWMKNKKLSKILELWVNGVEIEWRRLYGEATPPRIGLPTYPFAKEKYWIDASEMMGETTKEKIIHPLLHRNTSNFTQQRYVSTFTGEEFFLRDYLQNMGEDTKGKWFCQANYLEMIRAAIDQSLTIGNSRFLRLSDIVWGQPLVLDGDITLSISLALRADSTVAYEVYSTGKSAEVVHCQGSAGFFDGADEKKIDPGTVEAHARQTYGPAEFYAGLGNMGIRHGQVFKGVSAVYLFEHQLCAQICLPPDLEKDEKDFVLHPVLLDCAFQSSLFFAAIEAGSFEHVFLPVTIDSLSVFSRLTKKMHVVVRYSPLHATPDPKLDLEFYDDDGILLAQMEGLLLKRYVAGSGDIAQEEAEKWQKTYKPKGISLLSLVVSDDDASHNRLSKPSGISLHNFQAPSEPAVSKAADLSAEPQVVGMGHVWLPANKEELQKILRDSLADALYLKPSAIDVDKSFIHLGLDSIIGLEWIRKINQKFNADISSTIIYDYPTLRDFTKFLFEELQKDFSAENALN